MWDDIKEHAAIFVSDTLIKRVLPSLIAGWAAHLSEHLRWVDTGRPVLSEKSVEALVALAIIFTHYVLHLWFFLKRKAAEKAALERR